MSTIYSEKEGEESTTLSHSKFIMKQSFHRRSEHLRFPTKSTSFECVEKVMREFKWYPWRRDT
jgi:hypothetical protein